MTDINREFKLPDFPAVPIVTFLHKALGDGEILKVKAGWIATGIPKFYKVKYASGELTTDANVANRNVVIKSYYREANQSFLTSYFASGSIPASTTDRLIVGRQFSANAGATLVSDFVGWQDLIISGDDYMEIYINADEAGDKMNVIIQAEYLNPVRQREIWDPRVREGD